MIARRMFLAGSAALAMPAISRGAERSVLRFIPQSDVTVIDPVLTTAYVTRNHAALVFDTLFGMNGKYDYEPQMLAGSTTENDGRLWTLTLRDGLRFSRRSACTGAGLRREHPPLGRARCGGGEADRRYGRIVGAR